MSDLHATVDIVLAVTALVSWAVLIIAVLIIRERNEMLGELRDFAKVTSDERIKAETHCRRLKSAVRFEFSCSATGAPYDRCGACSHCEALKRIDASADAEAGP